MFMCVVFVWCKKLGREEWDDMGAMMILNGGFDMVKVKWRDYPSEDFGITHVYSLSLSSR